MILHHIQTSVSTDNALTTCLRYIHNNDCLLLSGDAVNGLLQVHWQLALRPYSVFVLQDDVQARGLIGHFNLLTQSHANITLINYTQFVAQTLEHDKVITW